MFWGLSLDPAKRYAKVVDDAFHISAAVLDTTSVTDDEIIRVMVEVEGYETLICNLSKKLGILQCPLDLQFMEGSRIAFYTLGGKGVVHLSGYVIPDLEDELDEEEEVEEEEENSDEETPALVPINKKRKQLEIKGADAKKAKVLLGVDEFVDGEEDGDDDDDDDDDDDEEESDEEGEEEEEEDDDDDDDDDEPDEEEREMMEQMKAALSAKPNKMKNESQGDKTPKGKAETPGNKVQTPKAKGESTEQKTPKAKEKAKQGAKTPEVKKAENKTPKKEAVTMNGTPKQKKPENTPAKIETPSGSQTPKMMKIGGMKVEELKVGQGPKAKPGNMVFMYYEGRFPNGKMFDKCQVGKGFGFRLGRGEVIKGWDMAIVGMQPGGKRKIVCPPKMAYGERGAPPDIPPNSTLIFNIELKTIK
ncbi:LOW QUALITY PROTEIN: 46 kDa FK506-binding nuclear protein-like [Penaeus monodon]|uniref:LOW QUALITY PROTEIN: 46 kDa FK506-binding nuclear protein-like n=1 Tax=Penaeus monodon TaxID=6687 RepID=UPI0018A7AA36|nr:LOW QUALITY PROTEIN: 46 kDa FK506-binding nuclear protein-like [Penaeus monodon]